MSMPCPICGHTAHVRTSRPMSEVSREQYFHCQNARCQHIFVGMLSIVRTVGDSLLPKEKQSGWPFNYAVPRSKKLLQQATDDKQLHLLPEPEHSG